MTDDQPLIALRARYVFPVDGPPIDGGEVTIRGSKIVAVGKPISGNTVRDLGDVAIVPGLVNAHTHLEFSDLATPIGRPGISLPEWIAQVVAHRRAASTDARAAISQGLRENLACGTTALGEIATGDGRQIAVRFSDSPITSVVFRESIAPLTDRVPSATAEAEQFLISTPASANLQPALSPHAPYTVHPHLLEAMLDLARRFTVPLAMHLAESREELELLERGTGPFRAMLERLDAWDAASDARYPRILNYLERLAAAPRALVVHGNYLSAAERNFLAERADQMSVVYCPRTHDFFGHDAYPLADMLAAGVAMALGTDSRASNPDLSMLNEMRFIAERHIGIGSAKILELGTLGGARALGLANQIGSLAPGKLANLAIVGPLAPAARDPHDALFAPGTNVQEAWSQGRLASEAKPPPNTSREKHTP
jgi:cytosine/adenosine deaminase-related metal-dependent hydrolase